MSEVDSQPVLKAVYKPLCLDFKFEAVTSRARMRHKDTYLVKLYDPVNPERVGYGECALFRGLSAEDDAGYEKRLVRACEDPVAWLKDNAGCCDSSITFGLESAISNLGGNQCRWHSGEVKIPINGLVWMGDCDLMARRVEEKLDQGFKCLKLKIGGIDFRDELELLRIIRENFPADRLQLRVDANGAFTPDNAMDRLEALERYDLHSIEQPIRQGQWEEMAWLCRESPIPIALDEELIPLSLDPDNRERMLDLVMPAYIILKPSLCGGFGVADRWIEMARERGIGWWATSALESNIGLDAIARWLGDKNIPENEMMHQGLGTGMLYHNNIPSPVIQQGQYLTYNPHGTWQYDF